MDSLDDEVSTIKEIVTGMAASKNLVLGDRNIPAWLADFLVANGIARDTLLSDYPLPTCRVHSSAERIA